MKLRFSDWATNVRTVAMFKREEAYNAEIAQLRAIVGELGALIPLGETIAALRTGTTMVRWFKSRLDEVKQLTAENQLLKVATERAILTHNSIALREPLRRAAEGEAT